MVCEGELVHTDHHTGGGRIVARRKPGDFFRLSEAACDTKVSRLSGSMTISAPVQTTLLLLMPDAIKEVIADAKQKQVASGEADGLTDVQFSKTLAALMQVFAEC